MMKQKKNAPGLYYSGFYEGHLESPVNSTTESSSPASRECVRAFVRAETEGRHPSSFPCRALSWFLLGSS